MAIEDNASIALIPSGYKSGKLYSVIPDDGDGDFTHSRGSTATRVAASGLIETVASGVPRLDYPLIDGVVQDCPALLLEPSRTNLMPTSEDFSSADWNRATLTITSDDAISPYGTSTADKITFTGSGTLRTQNTFTFTNAYTYSIFVKKGNSRYVTLRSFAFTTSVIIGFDLDSVTAQTGGVIKQYPNDWFRLSISKDVSSDADKNGYFYFYLPDSLGSTTSVNGNYAYIFGNQIEEGSYKTSYIKTSGSVATRSADVCNGSGTSAEFNDSEGVLFAEISAFDDTTKQLSISDGTTASAVKFLYLSGNIFAFQVRDSFATQVDIQKTLTDVNENIKAAAKYKSNDFSLWVNGFEIGTDTSGTVPSGLSELAYDDGGGGSNFYSKSKQLMTFKTALTDSELETLTSWDSFNAMAKGQLYTIE